MDKISKNKQEKIDQVTALKEKIVRAKTLFLTDYRGLTHQQMEVLRKALKKVQGEFLVAKNTLIKLSLENPKIQNPNIKELFPQLANPTAAFLAMGDEIAAIKVLSAFIKNNQLPKIKLGLFDGKLATEKDFNLLASLPTKETLLANLVGRLQSPIYGFHHALSWNLIGLVTVLDNVKGKKAV